MSVTRSRTSRCARSSKVSGGRRGEDMIRNPSALPRNVHKIDSLPTAQSALFLLRQAPPSMVLSPQRNVGITACVSCLDGRCTSHGGAFERAKCPYLGVFHVGIGSPHSCHCM